MDPKIIEIYRAASNMAREDANGGCTDLYAALLELADYLDTACSEIERLQNDNGSNEVQAHD